MKESVTFPGKFVSDCVPSNGNFNHKPYMFEVYPVFRIFSDKPKNQAVPITHRATGKEFLIHQIAGNAQDRQATNHKSSKPQKFEAVTA
jgi:hypothetical protein